MQWVCPAEHAVRLVQQLLVALIRDVHHTRHAAGACRTATQHSTLSLHVSTVLIEQARLVAKSAISVGNVS